MDYTDRIEKPTVYQSDAEIVKFFDLIHTGYGEAIKLVSGAKLNGINIDTDDLEEVIAALYFLYTNKEWMVKTDG